MSNSLHLLPSRSLRAAMLFSALPPALQGALRSGAPLRRFADGQLIQQKGDAARGFWLIEEGAVAAGQFLESGEFRAVALLGPGDSYGELAWLSGNPRIVDAVARGPAALRHIDGAGFERALAADPAAMRALLGAMATQLQEVLDLLPAIRRGSIAARAAAVLANLAGGGGAPREVTVTQQELADLLGVTRASVSGALGKLESAGLIERAYGRIRVPDAARLRAAALV
ncbi:MAG: Crp/Fnr family transcriptional regulator [Tsuneonella sp.]